MKIKILLVMVLSIFQFYLIPKVFAHSGRTDSSGGHNCNVGACAGTYHYHNGGSAYKKTVPTYRPVATYKPVASPVVIYSPRPTLKPSPTPVPTYEPVVRNETSQNDTTSEDLDAVVGVATVGGLGLWGYQKLKNKKEK